VLAPVEINSDALTCGVIFLMNCMVENSSWLTLAQSKMASFRGQTPSTT
jgi:hypothetical protein